MCCSHLSKTFFILVIFLPYLVIGSNGNSTTMVDVFNMGEAGYYCIKIPSLLSTINGTLLAFGEGRRLSCGDYTWTDLVYKRSFDNGLTWTDLKILYSNSSSSTNFNVIGNAAPVQDRNTGRIIIPFCRNNLEIWLITSDDDGNSWSIPTMIDGVVKKDWHWIGTGPPSSLQLSNGRIITPSYHSPAPHDTDGEITHSHIMYSDDGGNTWNLGGMFPGPFLTNENQAIQFPNETIYINARGLLTFRIQGLSNDNGESIYSDSVHKIPTLVEPLEGCEGSTIYHPKYNMVFYSGPNSISPLRYNMSLFTSSDYANSWNFHSLINNGRSAYSSLAILKNDDVAILYERSNLSGLIFIPQHISFLVVYP